MKISLVQNSIEWLNPSVNRSNAEVWIKKCEGSDLCLLPEMFSTGFCMDSEKASCSSGETLEWMKNMARKYQIAIAGGVAVEQSGSLYNRFYVVERSGKVSHYDKRHLFSFAGEGDSYRAGEERVVVNIGGVRLLLLVCYDLRFPVWSRNRGDYDVMLCIASWPKSRRSAWDILLRARAVENLCYVCGVNIVGSDPQCEYSGGTVAIDFLGSTVASVADYECGAATLDVDMGSLKKFRERFSALNDGDRFEIL